MILGDFGTKYAEGNPTKYHGNNPVPRGKFNSPQENNAIINNAMDDVLINETKKLSAAR